MTNLERKKETKFNKLYIIIIVLLVLNLVLLAFLFNTKFKNKKIPNSNVSVIAPLQSDTTITYTEIPTSTTISEKQTTATTSTSSEKHTTQKVTTSSQTTNSTTKATDSTHSPSTSSEDTAPTTTVNHQLAEGIERYDAVLVCNDKAYELYNYSDKCAHDYADIMDSVAERLDGISNVYSLLPPTSMGIQLPQEYKKYSMSHSQIEASNKMYSYMGDKVHKVPLTQTLLEHKDEYIYFRTDHHWTALGAYYAYCEFAKEKEWDITPLSEYQCSVYDNFNGTFCKSANYSKLLNNPDTVNAYHPLSKNVSFYYKDANDKFVKWPLINDVSTYGTSGKYMTFCAGDHSYSVVYNDDVKNGKSCAIVKDSYANAFIPFLVDNYETVHIFDYRYYQGNVVDFVKDNSISDLIFLNNISLLRAKYTTGRLAFLTQ